MKRCLLEDPDVDGHPIACLNMELVEQFTRKLSPVDFLQRLKQGFSLNLQQKQKGKRENSEVAEGSKRRTKKIKLN